mmetsp:Transcript_10422/g.10020  ORF Transcript_10422/g.10020 Transcript_10422/m.10020 type:complete len:291 (-) Transcript_10422:297-1169(-)|eukprot:CAMPEP_0197835762 /NCGR_PEP_ID=MMETSP1437-20131217/26865_1 /TAXON_ID=49252 ORGANISM="Eucampia antarctica, Strain CCMP1452" /NCGR_SAMPLE_ID=MMETSP1437 /ASSEMBLY_ACC=CAM_ASM_001096 /LENGTH=290 /DNA_ID=CAMNT_0043441439 /DNA_START=152 /DNA_END=1024 /DNA_ORIENTATION=+
MSSLRNAVKRVTHKERSQPQARAHLGILEKKKDYRIRARVFHSKEDRVKAMREKAEGRNPDEFYFGMHNSEVKDGRHIKTMQAKAKELEDVIGSDAVKMMKNQDLSYLRLLSQRDRKKIEKMQSSLHYIGNGDENDNDNSTMKKKRHTVFVQNREDAENFDVANHFNTVPELVNRSFNRPRKDALLNRSKPVKKDKNITDENYDSEEEQHFVPSAKQFAQKIKLARRIAKARSSAYGEMEARNRRLVELEKAESHLVTEKIIASKGRKRKVKEAVDGKPAIYKFRKKRAK